MAAPAYRTDCQRRLDIGGQFGLGLDVGCEVPTNTFARALSANNNRQFHIGDVSETGTCAYTGQFLNGKMDDVRVYKRALDPTEGKRPPGQFDVDPCEPRCLRLRFAVGKASVVYTTTNATNARPAIVR